jgi:hypothetical protein
MSINFPNDPDINDEYTFQGKTWVWNGSKWNFLGVVQNPISISGDDFTNESRFITFVDSTTGDAEDIFVSSNKLFFNPSTGTLNASEFNSLSDINLKNNKNVILDSQTILNNIETISFNWKDTGIKSYGVIAQQLEKILPELVTNSSGKKYVNYIPLIAILIDGFKTLESRIEKIENDK